MICLVRKTRRTRRFYHNAPKELKQARRGIVLLTCIGTPSELQFTVSGCNHDEYRATLPYASQQHIAPATLETNGHQPSLSTPNHPQSHSHSFVCGVVPVSPGADGLISFAAFSDVCDLTRVSPDPAVDGLSPFGPDGCAFESPRSPSIAPLASFASLPASSLAINPPESFLRCLCKPPRQLLPFRPITSYAR